MLTPLAKQNKHKIQHLSVALFHLQTFKEKFTKITRHEKKHIFYNILKHVYI